MDVTCAFGRSLRRVTWCLFCQRLKLIRKLTRRSPKHSCKSVVNLLGNFNRWQQKPSVRGKSRRRLSVTKCGSRMPPERFHLESPNFSRDPYRATLQPHRIWRHRPLLFSIYWSSKEWPKMPPPTTLGHMLVAWRFACSTSWWASCFYTSNTQSYLPM